MHACVHTCTYIGIIMLACMYVCGLVRCAVVWCDLTYARMNVWIQMWLYSYVHVIMYMCAHVAWRAVAWYGVMCCGVVFVCHVMCLVVGRYRLRRGVHACMYASMSSCNWPIDQSFDPSICWYIYLFVHSAKQLHTHLSIYTHIWFNACMGACMCACTDACMHVCLYVCNASIKDARVLRAFVHVKQAMPARTHVYKMHRTHTHTYIEIYRDI